ncbi:E3 ubiquitin-protein ligase PPP1R11-like [Mytilus californianus]|uniref:E3 ubiquitin-protein ligase PPP1R11-like n=1 Tax=Mytilus californianus TaxID=6549 RepID=UPI002247C557|nr:E3 ubiquitin-protein ligase PPP1R11-like [Mytilus californianus]
MAEASAQAASPSVVLTAETQETRASPRLHLKLRKPKNDKKVKWTTETVDNEHLNKKKSKCCCVYEKPKMFGESSDEDDDDFTCNCHGHKDKCFKHDHDQGSGPNDQPGPSS